VPGQLGTRTGRGEVNQVVFNWRQRQTDLWDAERDPGQRSLFLVTDSNPDPLDREGWDRARIWDPQSLSSGIVGRAVPRGMAAQRSRGEKELGEQSQIQNRPEDPGIGITPR
jgi:hypothetical protein